MKLDIMRRIGEKSNAPVIKASQKLEPGLFLTTPELPVQNT
jgi:hypothetical protein